MELLEEENYEEASRFINSSLQSQPKNVALHLLNSITYEKLHENGKKYNKEGNINNIELANSGYQTVLNIDPSNVFALIRLGKIKYNEQLYDQAQEYFANALLKKPHDANLWHELAAASYYAYDMKTAITAISKAQKLNPEDPLINRSMAIIHATVGDIKTAKKNVSIFQQKMGQDTEVHYVESRVNDWINIWDYVKQHGGLFPNSSNSESGSPSAPPSSPSPSPSAPPSSPSPLGVGGGSINQPEGDEAISENEGANIALNRPFTLEQALTSEKTNKKILKRRIIIDCYLLRISEDISTSKGNNILENLAVTLNPGSLSIFKGNLKGDGVPKVPFDSVTYIPDSGFNANQPSVTKGAAAVFTPANPTFNLNSNGSLSGRIFTAGLTWAGLTYNLNIANATDARTEVISRPSLMTFLGKPSIFFSGNELVTGITGQYGGNLVKYPVGVTLEITPESLNDNIITLTISIEGSLIASPETSLQSTVNVGKTRIDTFTHMQLGETIMLGGLYERIGLATKSGFPGLQDIPVVQYFFSNESTYVSRRTVVFLITPRSPDLVKTEVDKFVAQHHLTNLSNLTPDWFKPQANLVSMLRYLSKYPIIYHEFRSGDVIPPSWGWEPSIQEKLKQIKGFLYY